MPFYEQTWFLSIISGFIAVLVYHIGYKLTAKEQSQNNDDTSQQSPKFSKPGMYIGVFMIVSSIVYTYKTWSIKSQ